MTYYFVHLFDISKFQSSRKEPVQAYGDIPDDCDTAILVISPDSEYVAHIALRQLIQAKVSVKIATVTNVLNYETGDPNDVSSAKEETAINWFNYWCQKCEKANTELNIEIFTELLASQTSTKLEYCLNNLPKSLRYITKNVRLEWREKNRQRISAESKKELGPITLEYTDRERKLYELGIPFDATEADPEDVLNYGFYEDKNAYFVRRIGKDGQINYDKVSNFVMNIRFLIESDDCPRRIIEFVNELGKKRTLVMSPENLTSVTPFRNKIEGMGNFQFKKEMGDLMKIKSKLFAQEVAAEDINRLGWNKKNFWAWNNGISFIDENGKFQFCEPDEFGIVKKGDQAYFIESASPIFSGENSFVKQKKFKRIENPNLSLKKWTKLMIDSYGTNGYALVFFSIASYFSDIIFHDRGFMPMMFFFGPPQEGKTSAAKSMLSLFGEKPLPLTLEGTTTPKGLIREMALATNNIQFLDEYSNQLNDYLRGMIKGFYNRLANTKAKFTNDTQTTSMSVYGGIVLAGQDSPTYDIALFTRCIYLVFELRNLSDQNKENYKQLEELQATGFSSITDELVKYREKVSKEFNKAYEKLYKELKNPSIREIRLIENYAAIFCFYYIIPEIFDFGVEASEKAQALFHSNIINILNYQHGSMKNTDDCQTYWDTISYLAQKGIIKQGQHYQVSPDGKELHIFPQHIHSEYLKEMHLQRKRPISTTSAMKEYVRIAGQLIRTEDSMRIGKNRSSGWIINYAKIGVILPEDEQLTQSEIPPPF